MQKYEKFKHDSQNKKQQAKLQNNLKLPSGMNETRKEKTNDYHISIYSDTETSKIDNNKSGR